MDSSPKTTFRAGDWIDGRFYVADVTAGNATIIARQIGETKQECKARGDRSRADRLRANRQRQRRADRKRIDKGGE